MSFWQISGSGGFEDLENIYFFKVTQQPGQGMPTVDNISTTYGLLDGSLYQRTRAQAKIFSLIGTLKGGTVADLHTRRKNLIRVIAPDRAGSPGQPVILRYSGGASTLQASCFYKSGLELGTVKARIEADIAFALEQFDPYWETTTSSSAVLSHTSTITSANYIARLDLTAGSWGHIKGRDGSVSALAFKQDLGLFSGNGNGAFFAAGSMTSGIRNWNQSINDWTSLTVGELNSVGHSLAINNSYQVAVGGGFNTANGATACYLAVYDPTADDYDSTFDLSSSAFAVAYGPDNKLYVGGAFTTALGVTASRIAMAASPSYAASIMGGVNGTVRAIAVGASPLVYIGGDFTVASNSGSAITACYVARWNGTSMSNMGNGLNGPCYAMATGPDGTLYVGGSFTTADGVSAFRVAAWNGTGFQPVGQGFGDGAVWALTVDDDNNIYAGGTFTKLGNGGSILDNLAVFNGGDWQPLGFKIGGASVNAIMWYRDTDNASLNTLAIGYSKTGTASIMALTSVSNVGTAQAFPKLVVRGPGRIYQLINNTAQQAIYFDYALATNELITLDLSPGKKTFTSTFYGNIIHKIKPGSKVLTWSLLPGTNSIGLYIDGSNANTSASLLWTPRFWSIDN